jgi:hypothetical protein
MDTTKQRPRPGDAIPDSVASTEAVAPVPGYVGM